MPKREERIGEIAGYWLSRRPNSRQWCRTWFDTDTRQTKRASVGTDDLGQAHILLAQWITINVTMRRAEPREVTVGIVFARYFDKHGKHTVGSGVQRRNLLMMLERIPEGMTVGELTLEAQQAVVRRLRDDGYAPGTVKRIIGAAKAAITYA